MPSDREDMDDVRNSALYKEFRRRFFEGELQRDDQVDSLRYAWSTLDSKGYAKRSPDFWEPTLTEDDLCDACHEGFVRTKLVDPVQIRWEEYFYDSEHKVFYHQECWQTLQNVSTRTRDQPKPTIRKRDGTIL